MTSRSVTPAVPEVAAAARLRLLHLEDDPADAELVRSLLQSDGLGVDITLVDRRADYLAALEKQEFHLIFSDYSLPDFDGLSALEAARRLAPHTPFIFVSGVLGEESAVESLKHGATDYVLKNRLARLVPAVRRALAEVEERRTREEAQRNLREHGELFREVVENLGEVFYLRSPDLSSTVHYVNPAYEAVWGQTAASLYARPDSWMESVHADDRQRVRRAVIQAASSGHFDEVYRIKRTDGSVRWIRDRTFPVRGDSGVVERVGGFAEDITPRIHAEERLETQYAVTRALAESRDLAEATPRILRSVCELLHLDLGELWRLEPASNELRWEGGWQTARLGSAEFVAESQRLRLDAGRGLSGRVWAQARPEWVRDVRKDAGFLPQGMAARAGLRGALAFPLRSGDRVTGVMTFFSQSVLEPVEEFLQMLDALGRQIGDFIERKVIEERIREQAALLDSARDAIRVEDLQGRITYWNQGAERLYGWTREETLGQEAQQFLSPDGRAKAGEARSAVEDRGEWTGLVTQFTKRGEELTVQSHWTLIRDPAGQPASVLVIDTDVTEMKRLEAQVLRTQRLESIGTLAGGIAHDLNNVLAPIMMGLEILGGKVADEHGRRLLSTLQGSVQRGADLVKQVLTFARGAEGEFTFVRIRDLLQEIEKLARDTFPKSIHIHVNAAKDLWPVRGQATPLHQVLLNLCVNARDAMPDGGTLTLRAERARLDEGYASMNTDARPGPYVRLTVADTGTGIAPELMDKIFDPFFTTKEPGKGTGLGLSTVLAIVKGHGGFLEAESVPGSGTSFHVYLPGLEAVDEGQARSEATAPVLGNGEHILVVDDEVSIQEIARETLEAASYRVVTAGDGTEALALYAQRRAEIALVLIDMAMPFMDGAATIRALVRMDPEVKVIAMSGLAAEAKAARAGESAVRAVLTKPFTAQKLLSTIHDVLATR